MVCCSVRTSEDPEGVVYWLHNGNKYNKDLYHHIESLKETHIFLAYNVVAEARCFLTLGANPLEYKWVDQYLEYRNLLNHDHSLMYGKQLQKGRVKYTKPPKNKWEMSEEESDEANNSKPEYGMGPAVFKLLNTKIDTKFKNATRDLIISNPDEFSEDDKKQIMEYCHSDTEFLFPLFKKQWSLYEKKLGSSLDVKKLKNEILYRSEYACRTAIMERDGYPINVEKTKNFSKNVPEILLSCQMEINALFPDIKPFYKFKKKEGIFTLHQKAIRDEIKKWLKAHPRNRWMLTDGGKSGKKDLSLSLKAFQRHFNYTHNYPKDNFFAQIIRYLKLKQNLNGFTPGGKTNFWDYVGSDGFVRPYMGIYTAQSSRSQPKASSFIPLKSAWMRCLIEPPKGYAMGSIDYKSQEFLIAGLLSGDVQMIKDYATGDVYLAFGKSTGYIPKNGTKAEFKKERDNCKPVILGLQFDMTKIGLAKDLSEKWGRKVTEEEAERWIKKHKQAYKKLWRFKDQVARQYKLKKKMKLADGWYVWGDNRNFRSVGNIPAQGMGACVMRKAVQLAQNKGLRITYTLHDALYIMSPIETIEKDMVTLAECMDEAFRFYFKNKEIASVGLEGDIWSKEFPEESKEYYLEYTDSFFNNREMEIKRQNEYIDPRGEQEFEFFKHYLKNKKENINYETMEF